MGHAPPRDPNRPDDGGSGVAVGVIALAVCAACYELSGLPTLGLPLSLLLVIAFAVWASAVCSAEVRSPEVARELAQDRSEVADIVRRFMADEIGVPQLEALIGQRLGVESDLSEARERAVLRREVATPAVAAARIASVFGVPTHLLSRDEMRESFGLPPPRPRPDERGKVRE